MDNITTIISIILVVLIFTVFALIAAFIMIKVKEKNNDENSKEIIAKSNSKDVNNIKKDTKVAKEYTTKSIFDFMEFEGVKDNMIIQKKGKRFLMAIECQGINYDLMSEVEQASTEQGFASFLNTLKEPIQIYIQTRTVNLERNIQIYKEKLNKIKDELNLKEYRFNQYIQQDVQDEKVLRDKRFELLRQGNLYEYGRDIIADTEKMSLNKNILKKKYYIIIKYFYEPADVEEDVLSEEEIADAAFSNLYTKAVSLIRVLSGIGIIGRALNSYELVDLLYNAYNRDDSEMFGIDKAIEAGYNEIYIDSQSAIDKKIIALNKEIELRAKKEIEKGLKEVEDEKSEELAKIEENLEDIILDLARNMVKDEKNNIPEDVKEKVIEKIENSKQKKGEKETNGKTKTKQTTRTSRAG